MPSQPETAQAHSAGRADHPQTATSKARKWSLQRTLGSSDSEMTRARQSQLQPKLWHLLFKLWVQLQSLLTLTGGL